MKSTRPTMMSPDAAVSSCGNPSAGLGGDPLRIRIEWLLGAAPGIEMDVSEIVATTGHLPAGGRVYESLLGEGSLPFHQHHHLGLVWFQPTCCVIL